MVAHAIECGTGTLEAIFSLHRDQLESRARQHRTPSRATNQRRTRESLTLRTAQQCMPTLTGKYLVRESIGKGAFGHVYRALDRSTGQEVALKLLQSRHAYSASLAARFLREGRALQRLNHSGIVRIYELFREKRALGLAMEFVRGRTLEESLIEVGSFAPAEVARIGHELCSALAAVHGAGFVHRDIKAENIIQRPSGEVVLLDFGITRSVDNAHQLTVDGMLVGTPLSMAPEQHEFLPIDGRTDLYAVGCLLYQLLTARHPVEGHNLAELRRRVLEADYPPVRELRPAVPAELAEVVGRAMACHPDDRFQTAREVESALRAVLATA